MKKLKLVVALLISIIIGGRMFVLHEQNSTLVRQHQQDQENLTLTQTELKQIQVRLAAAETKLGYLDKNKTAVQVTAYAPSANSAFANGHDTAHAYAVPKHTLPEDHIVNVALSVPAQTKLHARLNDYIVLIQKRSHRKTIARFVDTMGGESRPVVDVYFASSQQAWMWGRRNDFYAVDISLSNSSFRGVLGRY